MPHIVFELPVDAPLQTIWNVLLDKIAHPERYMQGVEETRFLENEPDHVLREVLMSGTALKERITIDERLGQVEYQLIDHPLFTGEVFNRLIPPDPDDVRAKPMVSFVMNWWPANEEARVLEDRYNAEISKGIQEGVLYVKQLAEGQAGNNPEQALPRQEIVDRR